MDRAFTVFTMLVLPAESPLSSGGGCSFSKGTPCGHSSSFSDASTVATGTSSIVDCTFIVAAGTSSTVALWLPLLVTVVRFQKVHLLVGVLLPLLSPYHQQVPLLPSSQESP